ncbi:tRNA lysidine(34) synthetase TilS [Oceaniovalibus guishaninsula]|nr:tRNA lysidine(34) synthetase TilS [Oceaniovalibus guishaninsula]
MDRIAGGFWPLGLAVSGGGDSMALLHLAAEWAGPSRRKLHVVTVDHGLRDGSADEAVMVRRQAAALGLTHDTLVWRRETMGNLQDAARSARRGLIAAWAARLGVDAVLLGHTRDDQAETVLMRMARGSGVDGLAGMAEVGRAQGIAWLRPLLTRGRAELRDWLTKRGLDWAEDPGNENSAFDRVRARRMAGTLADLGLSAARLELLSAHMARARDVLNDAMRDLAGQAVRQDGPDLVLDRAALLAARPETRMRLLAAGLRWISGNPYRPRFAALQGMVDTLDNGTLHGVLLRRQRGSVRLMREPRAVRDTVSRTDDAWDGRWCLSGPHDAALTVRSLADRAYAGGRWPVGTLAASPAIWRGETLVAAPLQEPGGLWSARLADGRDDFHRWLRSH